MDVRLSRISIGSSGQGRRVVIKYGAMRSQKNSSGRRADPVDRHSFGSSPRSYTDLRNPNVYNENFGLLKKIRVRERFVITFRAELFNAFNRVVFAAPQANFSNAQFISAQANTPRQGQLALRFEF